MDDRPPVIRSLAAVFKKEYTLQIANNLERAQALLAAKKPPALVLLAEHLPIAELQQQAAAEGIPLLRVADDQHEEVREQVKEQVQQGLQPEGASG